MTLPAQIRVNAQAQFPSLVYGTGPITIDKKNGTWAIGYTIAAFPSQVPPPSAYGTDYLLAWDDVQHVYFKISLSNLAAAVTPPGATRAQRAVAATPIVITGTDQILNCKITTAAACTLPAAASRLGVPLTFKDLGQASANNITISGSGGELIDGAASYVLRNNFAWVTLVPFTDGVNSGWMVQ